MNVRGHIVVFFIIFVNINVNYAEESVLYTETGENRKETEMCENKKCIFKCCPRNYIIIRESCVIAPEGFNIDFSNVDIYNENIENTGKSVKDVFPIKVGNNFNETMTISDVPYTQNYLTEDGSLQIAFKLPNAFTRWRSLNKDYFCLDYEALSTNMTVIKPIFRVAFNNRQAQNKKGFYFKAGALLISCTFLMAVLVVYCILPELRTIGGKVLMACVASLFSAYMLLATMMLMTLNNENITIVNCISLTSAIYFFFMASFFWMNVMSWDIWWSFRGFAKIRPINRRGDSFKYFIYSIYAWGLPFGMLVMFVILNQIQVPGIISPSVPKFGCFIDGPEKMLYFYVPMLVLLICNWVLFLMTAFNIWRINKSTTVLNSAAAGTPAAHRAQRQRFLVYIKLSVVMGISFVLEVTSTQAPQLAIWYITDMYNMLIGVTIFFIFVCKKKIFRMLSEKLQKNRESKQQHNASETNVTYIDEQPYIDEHKEHFLLQNNTHNA